MILFHKKEIVEDNCDNDDQENGDIYDNYEDDNCDNDDQENCDILYMIIMRMIIVTRMIKRMEIYMIIMRMISDNNDDDKDDDD